MCDSFGITLGTDMLKSDVHVKLESSTYQNFPTILGYNLQNKNKNKKKLAQSCATH